MGTVMVTNGSCIAEFLSAVYNNNSAICNGLAAIGSLTGSCDPPI